jgi:hypothetical protein
MAYSYTNKKGQTYYLHTRQVKLKNGRVQTIYFFAREVRDGALDAVPAGYMVIETSRTGMPVLKRSEPKVKAA